MAMDGQGAFLCSVPSNNCNQQIHMPKVMMCMYLIHQQIHVPICLCDLYVSIQWINTVHVPICLCNVYVSNPLINAVNVPVCLCNAYVSSPSTDTRACMSM